MAFALDCGSGCTRAGLAGDDAPRVVADTAVGRNIALQVLEARVCYCVLGLIVFDSVIHLQFDMDPRRHQGGSDDFEDQLFSPAPSRALYPLGLLRAF